MTSTVHKNATHKTSTSVDASEMAHFAKMAEDWWNPNGKFKPLHIMNGCRVRFIKDEICAHFLRDPESEVPLKGLRILDVGCGGGLLCEPMARLGADVSGVDALEKNIKTAMIHAEKSGLDIDYRYTTIEDLIDSGEKPYDVVLNMEVLEHVTDPATFIKHCAQMLRPGGITFCSTINRTAKAFTLTILGAEYIMNWLPKGTHQYAKFITPVEMVRMLKDAGLDPDEPLGMTYNPLAGSWKITNDTSVNYLVRSVNV
ncbi:MAG: bifunctional 2-polyprenyl-6-hydroxyphenol methylase/3-demethylubiquinol 3-O-methyltransferase UbiG [Robiginitomaculum sp.]|nr:bifunctional 2-polyprenyl-6-hydroxyphenol methylase/3-demethylubiquinol 3-O-methyltransferase UbiG [Robiginitomaculum sp.]